MVWRMFIPLWCIASVVVAKEQVTYSGCKILGRAPAVGERLFVDQLASSNDELFCFRLHKCKCLPPIMIDDV